MFPDIDFNFFIDLFGFPRRRPPAPPQDQDVFKEDALSALPFPKSVPLPVPHQLPGTPPPIFDFPGLPGANDPIFRRTVAKRLLGLGGLLIDLEVLIIRELNKRQDERADDIIRESDRKAAEAGVRGREARAARERDLAATKRVEALTNAPETFDPTPEIAQPRPDISPDQLGSIVLFPEQFPDLFGELGEPGFGRDPFEFPEVPKPRVGFPDPVAVPVELPFPLGFPVPIPGPLEVPFTDPLTLFEPDPVPSGGVPDDIAIPGSGIDPRSSFQPNPLANPQLNPRRCPQRKCDDDLDDPRFECFKGLYKEGRFDTDFTSWVPIDCDTGRELSNNVIPFGR